MTPQTKSRPLICAGTSVKGFLAGTKTQTRRTRWLDAINEAPGDWRYSEVDSTHGEFVWQNTPDISRVMVLRCPYGVVGDRLWVREAWAKSDECNGSIIFAADDPDPSDCENGRWRSSMFMPRRYSRITLELEGVRVERVQDITAADVLAEGVTFLGRDGMLAIAPIVSASDLAHLRGAYSALWDAINKKRGYSWAANPYVFALTFRVSA